MKSTSLRLATLAVLLPTAFAANAASGPFHDLNALPTLGCKIPAYLGASFPAGVPSGKGGVDLVPAHATPVIKGLAIWSQTPPADDINTVNMAVAIPYVGNTIYGKARVEVPNGYAWSNSTHMKISVFKENFSGAVNSNSNIVGATEISSQTLPINTPQNVVSAALTAIVERSVSNNSVWTVVVQEMRNAANPTASNPNWSQISTVCEMAVRN